MLSYEIAIFGFVQIGDPMKGVVHHQYKIVESVPEEAAYAHGHINPGASQIRERYHLEAGHAPALLLPRRTHTYESQDLSDVVPVCAHCRGAPHADAYGFRVLAFVVEIPLDERVCELPAYVPGGLRGDAARVHRVEVASRGKDTRHASCRRARGAGRNEASVEPAKERVDLVRGALQGRMDGLANVSQHLWH